VIDDTKIDQIENSPFDQNLTYILASGFGFLSIVLFLFVFGFCRLKCTVSEKVGFETKISGNENRAKSMSVATDDRD
jgi:hypothetical protein